MNQISTPEINSVRKLVRKLCSKCNQIIETSETNCLKCGKRLESVKRIRTLGAISVTLSFSVLVAMILLAFWIYSIINQSQTTTKFNGNTQDLGFIFYIFGLVITICLATITAGLWQIIFGKRNKVLMIIVLLLGFIFIGTGLFLSSAKHMQ